MPQGVLICSNSCVLGDDDQTIYQRRRSEIHNILNPSRAAGRPAARRSDPGAHRDDGSRDRRRPAATAPQPEANAEERWNDPGQPPSAGGGGRDGLPHVRVAGWPSKAGDHCSATPSSPAGASRGSCMCCGSKPPIRPLGSAGTQAAPATGWETSARNGQSHQMPNSKKMAR